MKLRGIKFRPVYSAAGAQGFFGEGYPYHGWWKLWGLTFKECGFVAKTTTLDPRAGNMPPKGNLAPQEWRPGCIVVKFRRGVVLNAVGLSGPGAQSLLHDGRWQGRNGEPFFLSFMSVAPSTDQRLRELRQFVVLLKHCLPEFQAQAGLEINFSCPNAGLDAAELIDETDAAFTTAAEPGIPLQAKFSATTPVHTVCKACSHPACDALTMSNTIRWGELPDHINWGKLFGTHTSPLKNLGGGGLSGWPLAQIVSDWIREARRLGFHKPIWACGGIDCWQAVETMWRAGASGVQLGTVAIVRPWRMRSIIRYANQRFGW
jgi:dihydroorotate dehydrogenase